MIGLLWQRDQNDEPLDTTLTRACQRYASRFGCWPTVALVPEGNSPDAVVLTLDGTEHMLEICPTRRVPAGHVMVGIEGYDPSAPPVVRPAAGTIAQEEPAADRALVEVPAPPPPGPGEVTPAQVKRYSTLGLEPSSAPSTGAKTASKTQPEQLSLWRKLKRQDPTDSR
ncbi:MAG TPA: hypothetical protein DEP84_37170 [Chloroflexi bacterium]|nr:hypothetical protein [Chloroflexota bacterium]